VSHPDEILPNGRVLRYDFSERLTHWTAALSYIYLLLTGLAFWSPWCFWIAAMLGGGQTSRTLHPWIGLIFFLAVMYMYSMWSGQMHSTESDKQWWRSLKYYVQNEDDKMPPAGRYNAGQKILFWSFFYSAILLLLTGLVLWFPESIPWNLRWLRYIAVFLHPVVALATIANFMIHIYMSVFAERGAIDSMVQGDVSLHFAKRYHPKWHEEIVGRSSSAPRK
jgi:formate dehydrogenase subunit gamma